VFVIPAFHFIKKEMTLSFLLFTALALHGNQSYENLRSFLAKNSFMHCTGSHLYGVLEARTGKGKENTIGETKVLHVWLE
jgi:hypothetical protein